MPACLLHLFPMIEYYGFWPGFEPKKFLLHTLISELRRDLKVMGPFQTGGRLKRFSNRIFALTGLVNKADFFITGENVQPQFDRAKKQIGFWRSYGERDNVLRFPYWMWHLDWPEQREVPAYTRYGMPLSIDRLMIPISETYDREQISSRLNRAVLFSTHLREPRRRLFEITHSTLGCDGFGEAFDNNTKEQPKLGVMERYCYSLCPENSIGDGYITEKVPEAFHSGCIPIAWCRPDDLQEDFNPKAVVNLYGLGDDEVKDLLSELAAGGQFFSSLIREPLLLARPSLVSLVNFISEDLV